MIEMFGRLAAKIFYIIFVIVLISVSFYYDFLILKFISLSFLMLFFVNLIYFILLLIYYRSKKIHLNFSNDYFYPGENVKIYIDNIKLIKSFYAEFFIIFTLFEENVECENYNIPLQKDADGRYYFNFSYGKNGNYILKKIKISVKDVFFILSKNVYSDTIHSIIVQNKFIAKTNIPLIQKENGNELMQLKKDKMTTNFFDNRKYYPGDDTRKINWKVFAHSNDLYIREAEKELIHFGELNILFAPFSLEIEESALISSILFSAATDFLKKGININITNNNGINNLTEESLTKNKLSEVINMSFHPFDSNLVENKKGYILFTTFYEYINTFESLKNNFDHIFISVKDIDYSIKKVLSSLFFVQNDDNIFIELNKNYKYFIKSKYFKAQLDKAKSFNLSNIKFFHVNSSL